MGVLGCGHGVPEVLKKKLAPMHPPSNKPCALQHEGSLSTANLKGRYMYSILPAQANIALCPMGALPIHPSGSWTWAAHSMTTYTYMQNHVYTMQMA